MTDDFFSPRAGGDAQRVRADALGEPGKRRFRLLVVLDNETHIIWLEKQQLEALGIAIEQLLDQLPERPLSLDSSFSVAEFDDDTRSQFRAGRMELGFDVANDRLIIAAHDIQQEESEASPSLSIRITRTQAVDLSAEAARVVAAGRPRCPMCGELIEPGEVHVCPEQNGHLPLSFDDEFLA